MLQRFKKRSIKILIIFHLLSFCNQNGVAFINVTLFNQKKALFLEKKGSLLARKWGGKPHMSTLINK